eukprot:m.170882 g.170882  ORF g.170882 m.170882 type:complete len:556 (+) comp14537_c0_seq1:397-2064(+)
MASGVMTNATATAAEWFDQVLATVMDQELWQQQYNMYVVPTLAKAKTATPVEWAMATVAVLLLYIVYLVWAVSPRVALWPKAFRVYNAKLGRYLPFRSWRFPAGDFGQLTTDYEGFFRRYQALGDTFGGYVHWLMGQLCVLVTDPEVLHKVLVQTDDLQFKRDFSLYWVVNQMSGQGILTADGEEWRSQYRILHKAFNFQNIAKFRPSFAHNAVVMANYLESFAKSGEALDIQPVMNDSTLRVIINCAFGDSLTTTERQRIVYLFKYLGNETKNFLHQMPIINWFSLRLLKGKLTEFRELATRAVHRRREGEKAPVEDQSEMSEYDVAADINTVLIDLLLDAACEDPTFTDEKVRDNVLVFLSAGSETTSTTMMWLLYMLSENPEVYDKVMEENKQVNLDTLETAQDMSTVVPYLTSVIYETLRMHTPTGGVVPRICKTDMQFDYLHVPKGVGIGASTWEMHYNEKYWTEPHKFDPTRFSTKESLKTKAYIPFGIGRRYCIGRFLALAEMQVFLSHLLRRVKFTFVGSPEDVVVQNRPPIVQPRNGLKMKVEMLS